MPLNDQLILQKVLEKEMRESEFGKRTAHNEAKLRKKFQIAKSILRYRHLNGD